MMRVPVEDGDPLDAGDPSVGRRDGGVVHEAEPHRSRRLGMVAGGPAQAECRLDVPGQHSVDRRRRRARGDDRRVVAALAHDGVHVDRAPAPLGELPDAGEEFARVHALEILGRRRTGLLDGRVRRPDGVHDRVHPGRPFGMRPRIVQPEQVGHVTGEWSRL